MKRVLFAALAAIALAGQALGATTTATEFNGSLCILAETAACGSANEPPVNFCYRMRYTPGNVGTNGASTNLTLIEGGEGAQNYRLASGSPVGAAYLTVAGTHLYRLVNSFSAQMRLTAQSPATLGAAMSATIVGDITNFDDAAGCGLHFRGAGIRH